MITLVGIRFLSFIASLTMISIRLDVPQPGVEIALVLYRIEPGIYWEVPSGACQTDAQGECQIRVNAESLRDRAGFFRGHLLVNETRRSIIWPGGVLRVELSMNEAPRENPYDYLDSDEHPVQQKQTKGISVIPAILSILAMVATVMVYRAARKQKAG